MRRGNRVRTITVAFVLLSPAVVAAQGNGHGHAYGLNKNQGSAPSAAGAPVAAPAGPVAARHFTPLAVCQSDNLQAHVEKPHTPRALERNRLVVGGPSRRRAHIAMGEHGDTVSP